MITAVDTNVLLDILIPNPAFVERSRRALEEAAGDGSLVICDLVYAELCVAFEKREDCDRFLTDLDVGVESLTRLSAFQASRAMRVYRKKGGRQGRFLTDFLVGAHAQGQASRLLTRDRGFYGKLFPSLKVLEP